MKSNRNQKQVPLSKQSKRKQREHHALGRKSWGAHSPATKAMPNAKADAHRYNRKKSKHWHYDEPGLDFLLSLFPERTTTKQTGHCVVSTSRHRNHIIHYLTGVSL